MTLSFVIRLIFMRPTYTSTETGFNNEMQTANHGDKYEIRNEGNEIFDFEASKHKLIIIIIIINHKIIEVR